MKKMIRKIIRKVQKILFGSLYCAKKEGMICGRNITTMGGCNFGSEPYLITLGDNVRISNDVMFITHDGGNFAFRYIEEYKEVNHFGKIVVGEHSFIGARAIILPDVRIGSNCVIGAGAVVTKSVPDNLVVAGVPAKILCTTQEYANSMKEEMPELWNSSEYRHNKKQYLINHINEPTI